jgi:hypothetical protein
MTTNTYKEKEKKKEDSKGRKNVRAARKFLNVLSVDNFINRNNVVQTMPFVFFLTLLTIVYIANSYYGEKTIREIDSISKELKELRSEYISVKSELMFKSKQSEVAKSVEPMELRESVVPPKKIIVKNNNI